MPPQVKVGAIIRRGVARIPAETMRVLVENDSKLQEILDEIDARTALFLEEEEKIKTFADAVERAEADLAVHDAAVDEDRGILEADVKKATASHQEGMDALSRRTKEVMEKVKAAEEREAELDKLADQNAERARIRNDELATREGELETREGKADERDRAQHEQQKDLDQRLLNLKTAKSGIKGILASLG